MPIVDDRTPNLSLALPNANNLLSDDVARLRSALTDLDADVAAKADLVGGKVPASQLPSYVDDVLEYTNLAAFPTTGETGKIYVALDTNETYRWSGSAYVSLGKSYGPATATTLGVVKIGSGITVGGDGTISVAGAGQTFTDVAITPTSNGQTAFTVSGGYVVGAIELFLNGVLLHGGGDDYTASNGTSITLTAGVNTTDTLLLRKWSTFQVADALKAADFATQAEAEAGASTTKVMSPLRVKQAIAAQAQSIAEVATPSNVSPASGATAVKDNVALTGSAYYSLYGDAQAAIQVQVHTSNSFTAAPMYSSGDQPAGTSFALPGGTLSVSTTYWWRLRYKNARGVYSEWSAPTSFTTAAAFTSYIPTPTATPANFGDALEGGFYAGMVWEQLTQSATSTTIGTGNKTFTVPSMTSAPIVYAGQTLEVRSRANPANKMVGTVTNASDTSLTVNVTSVGGSGTFSDWSVMARFRIIVAPKASGENAGIALKNANSALPTACQTLTEGFAATQAMRDADTSTVYPAAHWARNLNIGGRTDWYIPARDELELCWRNLKPVTDNNYTTADRSTGQSFNYASNGSYGDTANTHGLNNNSSPTGAAYTTTVPGQTAATAFRTGGVEAFEFGSAYYWSSSEYSASLAWLQYWYSSLPGAQFYNGKTSATRVRAVRRSVI